MASGYVYRGPIIGLDREGGDNVNGSGREPTARPPMRLYFICQSHSHSGTDSTRRPTASCQLTGWLADWLGWPWLTDRLSDRVSFSFPSLAPSPCVFAFAPLLFRPQGCAAPTRASSGCST